MKSFDYFDPEDKLRTDSVIALLKQLDSKFTVHLVESVIQGMQIYLIFEYYPGGSLTNTIIELQKIPEKDRLMRVWEIFGQIALSLNYLHSHDVVNRNLKPSNIFINQDGSVRLDDFGFSKDITDFEYTAYVRTGLDFPSDIFQLGNVIFQLLTNMNPLEKDSKKSVSKCSVAFNPILTNGIVRFEGFFENSRDEQIGIADISVAFSTNKRPFDKELVQYITQTSKRSSAMLNLLTIKELLQNQSISLTSLLKSDSGSSAKGIAGSKSFDWSKKW
ncbi:MAG: hypothetical protein EZS28_009855 [Streblomastix strix]|uniref:non-specific serine/threonine protein kinase n=1 Tax=Streblomastix strix TaxID=222440 RepID=A0A5J4WIC5_9EUKA|nr:MAG: hypothetical protein EZS28_009855 [Streblomastix strix]